jgi:hypothetical protein
MTYFQAVQNFPNAILLLHRNNKNHLAHIIRGAENAVPVEHTISIVFKYVET